MFQLQRDGPAPPIPYEVKPKDGRKKYPLDTMQTGDFFFVAGKTRNSIRTYFVTAGKQHGIRLTSKLIYARQNDQGQWEECPRDAPRATQGVGVWCVG